MMIDIKSVFPSLETLLLFLLSFIFLISFIGKKWIFFHSKPTKNLPPSPPKLPIIGNFHQLGLHPNHSLQDLSKRHGPIMLLHIGSIPTLVVSSAEAAQLIMKTYDLSFASRPSLTIPKLLFYGGNDIAFSAYGEYWRQLKSMVVIHLLSNTRVKSFRHVREEEIGRMIGLLEESYGSLVDMSSLLVSLTNNIICRAMVGRTYDGSKLTDMLRNLFDIFNVFTIGSYVPWLSWVDWLRGIERRAKKVAKELDDFIEDVVEEHTHKKRCVEAEDVETQDFVDILLDFQNEKTVNFTLHRDALKAVLLDMFAAGTDTTFTTLHWTISELIKHPRVMKKLQEEVTETVKGRSLILEEDLEKMTYLKAIIKESLRLHGPLPLLLPRESAEDVKLNGYDIPAGTQVIINTWAIGRDPNLWEESEEFRPERFLNNSIEYHGLNFELTPFGAGRRGCPGIQFAVVVIELALANIVYKFDLALPNGIKVEDLDMSEKFGVTLHRKSPLMVKANPRI